MSESFAGVRPQREVGGRLCLEGCVAWIECGLQQLLKDCDLTIVLCPVRDFGWQDSSALGFWRSRFGQFVPREEPPPKP